MAKYYCDNLVEVWQRDWFEAESDGEAIALAETGDYDVIEHTVLDDYNWYIKNTDDKYVYELYNEHDNLIKRNEKG